ncbi:hypothetical protein JCM19237_2365 [Photobacterium aphoticum]|uniref:Uncharacterized protein n=1 Tax=Photobacterium aphoticum TaxID=754436 RepID=A0A090QQV6_9GAMM|nr:hypothetical protein JCM19237_2365 [Photobacterium aphoticum]
MSSKIYFQKSGKVNVRRQLVNLSTRLHHRLAPKHAKKSGHEGAVNTGAQ